jgi:hypothetical protein
MSVPSKSFMFSQLKSVRFTALTNSALDSEKFFEGFTERLADKRKVDASEFITVWSDSLAKVKGADNVQALNELFPEVVKSIVSNPQMINEILQMSGSMKAAKAASSRLGKLMSEGAPKELPK